MLRDVWFGVASIRLVVGVCRLGVDRITLGFFEGWISDRGKKGFSTQKMVIKICVHLPPANRHISYFLMSWEPVPYEPAGFPKDLHNESTSSAVTMALFIKRELVLPLRAEALSFMLWVQEGKKATSGGHLNTRFTKGIRHLTFEGIRNSKTIWRGSLKKKLPLHSITPGTRHAAHLVCGSFLRKPDSSSGPASRIRDQPGSVTSSQNRYRWNLTPNSQY